MAMSEDPEDVYCAAPIMTLSTDDQVRCGAFVGYTTEPDVLHDVWVSPREIQKQALCPEHQRQYRKEGWLV
jgi:hypothetical protein